MRQAGPGKRTIVRLAGLACLAVLAGCTSLAPLAHDDAPQPPPADDLALNDLQSVGSHNSYKQAIPAAELAMIAAESESAARTLDYAHPPLNEQLDLGMRQLELDVFYDPDGGRFAVPLLPQQAGEPYDDSGMDEPGFKVLHVADIDVRSHCATLTVCLQQIEAWSDAHPDHTPILLMFNAKSSASPLPQGAAVLLFDATAFAALDAEIRAVLGPDDFIEPDDVRGAAATLRDSVRHNGWPSLAESRGQLLLALDERPEVVTTYMRGRASLEGLPLFVNSITSAAPHAAYLTINDPVANSAAIREAVQAGYLVRTRSDANTTEARSGDTTRREAAFASGAQYISTDYYLPRSEWSEFQVNLPAPAVCNPVRRANGCVLDAGEERWLAGDHHIHSRYSVGWEEATSPPTPVLGGDAIYPIPMNAVMARRFGLDWIVATDHGGPNHSKISHDHSYPELLEARAAVPDLIQFFGIELNSPAADHSSIIVPQGTDEAERLVSLEAGFDSRELYPRDPARDREEHMIAAVKAADAQVPKPIIIAHHPGRSAGAVGEYGRTTPHELRAWNDAAPQVAIGMEGAPGHQATAQSQQPLSNGDPQQPPEPRGLYRNYPTLGGYDQMTAILGGFWDSMLGEGRRWWITANSDSHIHWSDGGADFWPGEYSKTYVRAAKSPEAILASIRAGRMFVTTGDLVSAVDFTATDLATGRVAETGGNLSLDEGRSVRVTIRIHDPATANANGDNPSVSRVDLIRGQVTGLATNRGADSNPTTFVEARFTPETWVREREWISVAYDIHDLTAEEYIRLRGTNTSELEPLVDAVGENVWDDLWFYTNPIFLSR